MDDRNREVLEYGIAALMECRDTCQLPGLQASLCESRVAPSHPFAASRDQPHRIRDVAADCVDAVRAASLVLCIVGVASKCLIVVILNIG
ncbi:hypothetical protein [Rhodopseudomonas parapalustris]